MEMEKEVIDIENEAEENIYPVLDRLMNGHLKWHSYINQNRPLFTVRFKSTVSQFPWLHSGGMEVPSQ